MARDTPSNLPPATPPPPCDGCDFRETCARGCMSCEAFVQYVVRVRFDGAERIPNRRTFEQIYGHVRERLADLITPGELRAIDNARWRKYYRSTHDARLEQKKRWRQQLGDAWRESRREYRARNAERMNAQQRALRAANPERYREYDRKKYAKHREQQLAYHRDYYRQHRERKLAAERERRALRRAEREAAAAGVDADRGAARHRRKSERSNERDVTHGLCTVLLTPALTQ